MPPIPPAGLVVGQPYISVHRERGHHSNPLRFLGLDPVGFVTFNAGRGARISDNPESYNFYAPGNANLPPPVVPFAPAPAPIAPPAPMPAPAPMPVVAPTIAAARHRGEVRMNPETLDINSITQDDFVNREEIIVLEGRAFGFSHIFKIPSLQVWFDTHDPPTNPRTNHVLAQTDIERYTLVLDPAAAAPVYVPDPHPPADPMAGRRRSMVNGNWYVQPAVGDGICYEIWSIDGNMRGGMSTTMGYLGRYLGAAAADANVHNFEYGLIIIGVEGELLTDGVRAHPCVDHPHENPIMVQYVREARVHWGFPVGPAAPAGGRRRTRARRHRKNRKRHTRR